MSTEAINVNPNNKDELQAHIEEYKSTQAILNYRYTVEHNIHYWSILLLIGFTSLFFKEFIKQGNDEYMYILLLLALPFHLLSFLFLRNDIIIAANAEYCNKTLRPRLKKILGYDVWMREDAIYSTRTGCFNIFLAICRYGTTGIAVPIFVLIYFLLKYKPIIQKLDLMLLIATIPTMEPLDLTLLIVNLLLWLVLVVSVAKKVPEAAKNIVDKNIVDKNTKIVN